MHLNPFSRILFAHPGQKLAEIRMLLEFLHSIEVIGQGAVVKQSMDLAVARPTNCDRGARIGMAAFAVLPGHQMM